MERIAIACMLMMLATPAGPADSQPLLRQPSVARPVLGQGMATRKPGTVFFLRTGFEPGAVAIGTAHNVPWDLLSVTDELRFELGHSGKLVSVSSRLVVPPGRPFHAAGGSLREDFLVYALDLAPSHVRVLDASRELPAVGTRVQLLGIPSTLPHDEDDVFGTVAAAGPDRLQVDLDVPFDLRGWGGAPLVDLRSGAVIGILQAAFPREEGVSIAATPIGAVLEALRDPLEGGDGRRFDAFPKRSDEVPSVHAASSTPKPARAEPPPSVAPRGVAADLTPDLKRREREELLLEIRYPPEGSIVGDSAGVFLAGTALAPLGEYRRIDVAFVIDTSGSTGDPAGSDVDGDGVVGERRFGPFGTTDAGDSILAAEVAATRHFVARLDPRHTRVAIISFSGEPEGQGGGFVFGRRRPPDHAVTEVALTTDYEEVYRALDRILERGPQGQTHMAAGADQAIIELLGLQGALSESSRETERVVIFLTDGKPTLPYPGFQGDNVRAVIRAARRAHKADIRFHTYGIGDDALDGPVAIVELASITGGTFTPVRDPSDLGEVIAEINFFDINELFVRNDTTGSSSDSLLRNPDGSWSALVPLVVGANEITVVAGTSDGLRASETVTVHYAPGSADPLVPEELVAQRNELLQRRLVELRRERIATEQAAAETARRELKLEIERERAAAQERAEQQRKELELETVREDESP